MRTGHRSTPAERARLRAALAWRFDSHGRAVARLLALFPGLLANVAGEPEDALFVDLVAVRAVLSGDRKVVNEALRGSGPAVDPALLGCMVSGLRRLPTCRGAVYRRQPAGRGPDYVEGQVLTEPALVTARAHPRPRGGDELELMIWSTTARRVEGLTADDRTDEVVFPAGTRFVVLAVDGPRVLLTELPGDAAAPGEREARALNRLRRVLEAPPRPVETDPVDPDGMWLGHDRAGHPFRRLTPPPA